jgi:26S proteasome regulatory subunit N5
MDRREKLEFLLEQMRLCLAKHDYIRTQIISKKINTKAFEDQASHVNFYLRNTSIQQNQNNYSKKGIFFTE